MPGGLGLGGVGTAISAGAAATGVGLPVAGLIALGSGLFSGILGLGESPSEEATKKLFDKLYDNLDFLKSTPYTKDELFKAILPSIQKIYRGGANVAAGQLGATLPETGGAPQGQAAFEHYIQALAPVIAKGEEQSAGAYENFTKLYADMDAEAKSRFLKAIGLGGSLAQGLDSQTGAQKFFGNFLKGGDIGANVYGNISLADATNQQTSVINDLMKNNLLNNTGVRDIWTEYSKPESPKLKLGR